MVETVTIEKHERSIAVVELLGLPGSGKTTVVEALAASGAIVAMSRYRHLANVPAYSTAAVRLSPVLVARPRRGSSWRDRNRMIRLESSYAIVRRHARGRSETFVFDQGPLFLLKQLQGSGSRSAAFERRRTEILRQWAGTLDLALMLDAPDDVLLQRIRRRDKRHPLQGEPDDRARRALDVERRSFDRLFDELSELGAVRVKLVDTSVSSILTTADAVFRSIASVTVA